MAWRGRQYLHHPGPRHEPGWYDQSAEPVTLAEGDRLFVPCRGGPSGQRVEMYPPRLEIEERDGLYVLCDTGPRAEWFYEFVPRT